MKELELYDIITLDDNTEYTILQKLDYQGKKYCLIAPIDMQEEPNLENMRIVEEHQENDKILIEEETDEEYLKELSNKFLELLKNEY